MTQLLLGKPIEEQKIVQNQVKEGKIEYCKKTIVSELYLWDMRCWEKYKDKEEIEKWIENNFSPNNCGHTVYCIKILLSKGVGKEEIIELIMRNPHIQYKNRLVKCFEDANFCPIYQKCKNYSDCNCEVCE